MAAMKPFKFVPKEGEPLHELIVYRRKELGIRTQAELAELVGVTTVTVSNWEGNRSLPREYQCERLAKVLDVPEVEIFTAYNESLLIERTKPMPSRPF